MSKNIAVVLAGCGVFDGAEIHEATLTLLAIEKNGGNYQCFAPNIPQYHVVNHITGDEMNESRNVLVESARIARGNVKDLALFDARDYDAIIFPGGFGVAKNLSTLAFKGKDLIVNDEVKAAVLAMVKVGKPIGALCIAPAIMVKILEGAEVTIGNDAATIETITALGGKHMSTRHAELVVDEKYKLVTTPCYMLDANILQIAQGAENLTKQLMLMAE